MRAGAVPDQRLYRSLRPARRELAIDLLVDISGSTDAWVSGGLRCFCLTVDRHATGYLHRVFGPGRYAVLRHPAGLPVVLVDVLRQLLRG